MSRFRRHALAAFFALALIASAAAFLPSAHAQVDVAGLNAVGAATGLPSTDPRIIAVRIINVALGLIAIILVSIFVYAGFLYMTAGGDAEKVNQAKLWMRNAIIGVVIILSAWAITTFVISRLLEAAGGGGGSSGSGPGGGVLPPGGGGGPGAFQVRSITPSGSIPIRNVEVRFLFTRDVDAASASSSIHVLRASDSAAVAGHVAVSGPLVTFIPDAPCPAPNASRQCFDGETDFIARADRSLHAVGGQSLACGGFAPACEGRFHTGLLVDTQNPVVEITSPVDGQGVPQNDLVRVLSHATDDAGVSYVETNADGAVVGRDSSAASTTPQTFDATVTWDTTGLTTGTHRLQSRAYDIDSNNAQSREITVVARPQHCFNGRQDVDETGLDCGASCGACSGGSCTVGTDCASGVCTGGRCVEQPIITGVSPNDGRTGTFVTLSGVNFGRTPGRVVFADGRTATAPAACSSAGTPTWTPTQVIVTVPDGAVTGPISLTNATSTLSDTTNNDLGPHLDNFTVNTIARPGLCAADPDHGPAGVRMTLIGGGLGTTPDKVFFADREVTSFTSWTDANIVLNAPVLTPTTYAVKARTGTIDSNAVAFHLEERTSSGNPVIESLSPESGPIGEYVTLSGRNFGDRIGTVRFRNAVGDVGLADTTFPPACSTAGYWHDTTVVVKVPARIGALGTTDVAPGAYTVALTRQDGVTSNGLAFAVNTNPPRPGICSLAPATGPVDTAVVVGGERFGTSGQLSFAGAAAGSRLDAAVDPGGWTSTEIHARVPRGAVTGPVRARVGTADSNNVNFQVRNCNEDPMICGRGESCCATGACSVGGVCPAVSLNAHYAWRTSTGVIPVNPEVVEECSLSFPPSPSPWDTRIGGDRACLNSDIIVRFNTKIDPATVTTASLIVRRCTGAGSDPCSTAEPVPARAAYPQVNPADSESDYAIFRPVGTLRASSTYQVILTTAIRSDVSVGNLPMLENAPRCGTGNAYCYRFSTRASTEPCRVGAVTVAPNPFTANDIGQRMTYRAQPRSAEDICVVLDGSGMPWAWNTDGDGRASITNNINPAPPGNVLDVQTGTAIAETGPTSYVPMNADLSIPGSTTTRGTGRLFIRLIPPKVEAKGPDCGQACVNAAIWVRFNVSMAPTSFRPSTLELKRCANENCRTFDQTCDLSTASIELTNAPGAPSDSPVNYLVVQPTHDVGGVPTTCLEAGRYYRMLLRSGMGGVLSVTRLPLTELNDPEGYAWNFRTKTGDDARCAPATVNVAPAQKIERVVGARQPFSATPIGSPDQCNPAGQPLISDRSYSWASSDLTVARLLNDGRVDTTQAVGPNCSNLCLNTGANGAVGRVASCGNGVIETTDARYCTGGRTPSGDSCTVLPAGSAAGEECDLGGDRNGPGSTCSARCLWNAVVAGTCGNGTRDVGEQCDPGRSCIGGASVGRACATSAECGAGSTCGVADHNGCSSTCQALGSRLGSSVCGNGDLGDGETCDDGNSAAGDGCTADCLHEGSLRVSAVCGNSVLEPGESCERLPAGSAWPVTTCDARTCLNSGLIACDAGRTLLCCGNSRTEPGEDCDDGNAVAGDGCNATCLKEGSSYAYPTPSFCGDGLPLGAGEQCEAGMAGNGLIDNRQVSEIVGAATPGPDGRMTSNIEATYETKVGRGVHGLQCGFTQETSCPASFGLTNNGCCSLRPTVMTAYPPDGSTDVCRNVLISGTFNVPMETGSFDTNFIVAEQGTIGTPCASGTRPLGDVPYVARNWRERLAMFWQSVLAWFRPDAEAAPTQWCVGSVRGSVVAVSEGTGTQASFVLEEALKANTTYRVVFRGDPNLADAIRQGIKSASGVLAEADPITDDRGRLSWTFHTGTRICSVNQVKIRDTSAVHPYLFLKKDEAHQVKGTVQALVNGVPVPLSTVREYSWSWDPWVSSNRQSLQVTTQSILSSALTFATTTAQSKNGSSLVFARIHITNDEINVPSTTGQIIGSSRNMTVMLCERPWPSLELAPFADQTGSDSLGALASRFASGPYYNFSTLYCQDAGEAGPQGDLPAMEAHAVPSGSTDLDRGILRQYLFTFANAESSGDGIGIRILTNPLHLSPSAWYASQNFTGSPQSLSVDGYEAVRDGTTVYVAATNVADSTAGGVTSTIYLISHNPDAKEQTTNIYDQLVENWSFNINFTENSQNVCEDATGAYHLGSNGQPVECTADWECLNLASNLHCASFKAKIQRDTKRVADFQASMGTFEHAKETNGGKYPLLSSGSYLQTISTSRWPSWAESLGTALGGGVPTDPINRFLTCGRCQAGTTPCGADADCATGDHCIAQEGYDPATCWNPGTRRFLCPRLSPTDPASVSRIYQYRAVDGGSRYEFSTELEGPGPNQYQPPLLTEAFRCSNNGSLCRATHNEDCNVLAADGRTVVGSGTCNGTGGRWRYQGICTGAEYGVDDVCGNGVRGPAELCEIGDSRPLDCSTPDGRRGTKLQVCSDCREFLDGPSTLCVADSSCGNGRIDRYKCYGAAGYRYGLACNTPGSNSECVDPRDTGTIAAAMSCQSVGLFGGTEEVCDDGTSNGTYGHCNRSCSGIGATCGDGLNSLGETCDNGSPATLPGSPGNGEYCGSGCTLSTSCSIDCRDVAPHCGDRVVQAPPEQCDGGTEEYTGAFCFKGLNNGQRCTTDADCPPGTDTGVSCGGGEGPLGPLQPLHHTCVGVTAGRCTDDPTHACTADTECAGGARCVQYPTRHTRSCNAPGSRDGGGISNQCLWHPWSACEPNASCGNGTVEGSEECDDGNRSDNDTCTNACRRNICGDSHVNTGREECDYGTRNGTTTGVIADYGSTAIACDSSCRQVALSGGFCGDSVKNGPEQCDRLSGIDTSLSCRALGFDYASRVRCEHYGYVTNRDGGLNCISNRPGFLNSPCVACAIGTDCGITWHPPAMLGVREEIDSAYAAACVPDASVTCLPGAICTVHEGPKLDVIACNATCGFSGCRRCQDEGGSGTVSGFVRDAVYSNQPVPNARVTLYLRGIRVGETFTNNDGAFTLSEMNTRPECSTYRIVVDSYRDNPCTGTHGADISCNAQSWPAGLANEDEGRYGGYWAFESNTFTVTNFRSVGLNNDNGLIFLAPRVGPGETLVIHTWNGRLSGRYIDAHVILPKSMQYRPGTSGDWVACPAPTCTGGSRNGQVCGNPINCPGGTCTTLSDCTRDIYWSGHQGKRDLDQIPHANLFCFHPDTGTEDCNTFDTAPETMKWKRDSSWGAVGEYKFYLVDWSPRSPASYIFFDQSVSSTVRIVTQERLYSVRPPLSTVCTPACGTAGSPSRGKYWHVFTQRAADGSITVPIQSINASGACVPVNQPMRCTGESIMDPPDPNYILPGPVGGAGSG